MLGPHNADNQEVRVLNRIIRWTPACFKYEADPRHAELITRELGLPSDGKSTITTPGTKIEERDDDEPLDPHQTYKYRSIVARANFLAQDRADVTFSTKELSRFMAKPTKRSWDALVRLGKYLRTRPRCVQLL